MAMGSKAFESPLISHARMRAMYRALVEMRGLSQQRKDRSYRGVEACWAGSAIDLKDGDLTSDAGGSNDAAMLEYVRAVGRRPAGSAVKASEIRRVLKRLARVKAEAFPGSAAERMLCAAGSAMALKAAGAQGVAMAYAGRGEMTAAEWRRLLAVMSQEGLPLVVVVLPGGGSTGDLDAIAHKASARPELAVPVIPVDAGDVVAIYRVAQETIVRARAGGGAAVIEGVACGTDAVKLMGAHLVRKRICTQAWVNGVETHLNKMIAIK